VLKDVEGFRRVLAREWDIVLVPLDVSGLVIEGPDYAAIAASGHWAARAIMGCYGVWTSRHTRIGEERSSVLFDLVAADVALHPEKAETKTARIAVTDDGATLVGNEGAELMYVTGYREDGSVGDLLGFLLREGVVGGLGSPI
jgi:inosine-uridine nucleoside N-ribohydrolase